MGLTRCGNHDHDQDHSHEPRSPTVPATTSPLKTVPRFFRQPRLRLAYAITTTRSIFWMAVFVYGPIYVIEAGLPAWVGGAMLSSVSALLLLAPFVNRVAERNGVRWVVTRAFTAITVGLVALAIIGDARPIGLVAWGFAAIGGASLDVVGNIPFMRMVRPSERIAMTGVFSTWREVSSLIAPGIAAVCLGRRILPVVLSRRGHAGRHDRRRLHAVAEAPVGASLVYVLRRQHFALTSSKENYRGSRFHDP